MNFDDTQLERHRSRPPETGPGTWIAAALTGVVLAAGLLVVGDRYLSVAKAAGGAGPRAATTKGA